MPRKRIEFIEEYLCPNGNYHEYQHHDNHGILIRCKNCRHMSGRTDGSFVLWSVDCFCGCGHHSTGPEFYCADGELKHDTDDQ